MDPPENVDQLYAQLPTVVAGAVGGTCYVRDIDGSGGTLAHECPWVQARFSLRTGIVTIRPDVTKRLAEFFRSTATRRRGLNANEAVERWQLGLVKTDLILIVATVLRGIGPADPALMHSEWSTFWQFPHAHAVANGVPELLAELIVDQVAHQLGLTARDPRLAEASPVQARYVPQVEAMRAMTAPATAGSGAA